MKYELAELLVNAKRRRYRVPNERVLCSSFADHAGDIERRMLSRRKHVGKHYDVCCAALDTGGESCCNCGIGKLHVSVLNYHMRSGHSLNEVRHADEHVIRLAQARAVVNQENRLHRLSKYSGISTSTAFLEARETRKAVPGARKTRKSVPGTSSC